MEKQMYELKINPELQAFMPPLSEKEYSDLEQNIVANGCRVPLVVWNGIIVDGHHRFQICRKHNIPFEIEEQEFADIAEAKVWMYQEQSCRRNMGTVARVIKALELKPILLEKGKANQGHRSDLNILFKKTKGHNTRKMIAEMAGTSETMIQKIEKILEVADKDTVDALALGTQKVGPTYSRLFPKRKNDNEKTGVSRNEEPLAKTIDQPAQVPYDTPVNQKDDGMAKESVEAAIINLIESVQRGIEGLDEEERGNLLSTVETGVNEAIKLIKQHEVVDEAEFIADEAYRVARNYTDQMESLVKRAERLDEPVETACTIIDAIREASTNISEYAYHEACTLTVFNDREEGDFKVIKKSVNAAVVLGNELIEDSLYSFSGDLCTEENVASILHDLEKCYLNNLATVQKNVKSANGMTKEGYGDKEALADMLRACTNADEKRIGKALAMLLPEEKKAKYRIDFIEEPFEVPSMRDDPMREPRPYPFVKDQIWFANENYLKELKIGLNWLMDEDTDKLPILLHMVEDGHKRARSLFTEMNE